MMMKCGNFTQKEMMIKLSEIIRYAADHMLHDDLCREHTDDNEHRCHTSCAAFESAVYHFYTEGLLENSKAYYIKQFFTISTKVGGRNKYATFDDMKADRVTTEKSQSERYMWLHFMALLIEDIENDRETSAD